MQVLDSEPNSSTDNVEVTPNSEDYESNVPVVDVDLPIAIRKGVRKCTQQPVYPLSHFVSCDRLSSGHKSFLIHLNTITIPKTVSEALGSKEWKEA